MHHIHSQAFPEQGAWHWRCRDGSCSCLQRAPPSQLLSITRISTLDPSWPQSSQIHFQLEYTHARARVHFAYSRQYVANTAKFHAFSSCPFLARCTHHHPESRAFFSVEPLLPWPPSCVTQSSQQVNTPNVLASLSYSPAQKPSRAL